MFAGGLSHRGLLRVEQDFKIGAHGGNRNG